jgi:hypothetical protein
MNKKILNIIKKKRELSQIPEKDIEIAYSRFEKNDLLEEEKIKKTKEILRKNFIAFVSKKLFSPKDKSVEWILRKHISTKERLPFYQEIYKRIFKKFKKATLIDLGAGINGFSYSFFPKNVEINYFGIESVGQLVDLTNIYFKKNKISGKVIHMSLFEKENLKKFIKKQKKPRVIFLFKVIDSLEIFKKNYSKELILEIIGLADFMVLSFATKTLRNKKPFFAKRDWIIKFIKENFKVLDDFEFGGERYFVFSKFKVEKDL